MIELDDSVVAIWYVSYDAPVDMLCVLRQLKDHFHLVFRVRQYDEKGEIELTREFEFRRMLVPLSQAIDRTRKYIHDARNTENKVQAEWEVLRGARTTEEFCVLLASMPNAHAREATPEEAEMISGTFGVKS